MIYVGYNKVLCNSWCDACSRQMVVDQNYYLKAEALVHMWFCSNECMREDFELDTQRSALR